MRLYRRNEVGALTFTALSTTGVAFDYSESDEKTVFVAKNADTANAGTITVVQGNGLQGVTDITLTVPKSGEVVFTLDSMLFKNNSGKLGTGATAVDLKGKVVLKGAATLSVAVIALP